MTLQFEVNIENQQDAEFLMGTTNAYMETVKALKNPKPHAEIKPCPEPEGEPASDKLAVAQSKLIIPGQNGQPS